MPRTHQVDISELRNELRLRKQATALDLSAALGVSRPTISRLLSRLGDEVVRMDSGQRPRYTLRREIPTLGHTWPLYRVDEQGELLPAGSLEAVEGGFRLTNVPPVLRKKYPDGFFEGFTPFFLNDSQPQGFLGRICARGVASQLGTPVDPNDWSAENLLNYLVHFGEDLPGDWVVGDEMAGRIRRRGDDVPPASLAIFVHEGKRAERYPQLAGQVMLGEPAGSSAGGEQPKFMAQIVDDVPQSAGPLSSAEIDSNRAAIIKFSPVFSSRISAASQRVAQRWADLLLAEYHAFEVLRLTGTEIPVSDARIFDAGGRRFLEVIRFDRVGSHGRRGVISLRSVARGMDYDESGSWATASATMLRDNLLEALDARRLRRLYYFGVFIGNTDMHFGNVSFFWKDEAPLSLAPVYDMLPMAYRPSVQGEIVDRDFPLPVASPESRNDMGQAARWALDFWSRVCNDKLVSSDFRDVARNAYGRVERFLNDLMTTSIPTSKPDDQKRQEVSFAERYPHVAQAVLNQKKNDPSPLNTDRAFLEKVRDELVAIAASGENLMVLAREFFPEGLTPAAFAKVGPLFYVGLGTGDTARSFVKKLWLDVVMGWIQADREAFLDLIIRNKMWIFRSLDYVSDVFRHARFTKGFMFSWLKKARKQIGDDLYQIGFWNSVAAFVEHSTKDALELASFWLDQKPGEREQTIIARMVGHLRLQVARSGTLETRFRNLENRLKGKGWADWRALYLYSWEHTRRGGAGEVLSENEALGLRDEIELGSDAEITAWCRVLVTFVWSGDMSARGWIQQEMDRLASPRLSPAACWSILQGCITAWKDSSENDPGMCILWENTLIKLLPFDDSGKGAWNQLGDFLRDVGLHDSMRLLELVRKIANKSGIRWIRRFEEDDFIHYLTFVAKPDLNAFLATNLCFGKTCFERKTGLLIFARSGVQGLQADLLNQADARQVELVYREVQASPEWLGADSAQARLHACLASRMDEFGGDLSASFYEEVELQALNTHEYREALSQAAPQHERLRGILETTQRALQHLGTEVAKSPALQMQAPGYARAQHVFARRFSRDVERSANEQSIFVRLGAVKEVHLLYGKSWRIIRQGGELSRTSELCEFSHSVELPRMNLMDYEGMWWRRMSALHRIDELEQNFAQS
ncbi:MAG: HipA domain-containing protein [Opitutaceae bacterium]|jgi:hypothetical protein|nr:HipA domain-containing protein [Opitutaceae bacterium]